MYEDIEWTGMAVIRQTFMHIHVFTRNVDVTENSVSGNILG